MNSFPYDELEETTRELLYYEDEDYPLPARQSLPEWSNRCGSELSIVETDVYVWRYTLLVVIATKERVEVNRLIDAAD